MAGCEVRSQPRRNSRSPASTRRARVSNAMSTARSRVRRTRLRDCHMATYQATKNPNHVAAGFPTTCETCHTTAQWPGAKFDHNTATKFPLTGKHTAVQCAALPRQQRLQGHGRQLRRLPHGDLPGHQESQPRRRRLPDHLRDLPHHGAVAGRQVRSQQATKFPLTGKHTAGACAHATSTTSTRARRQLRRLPPGDLPGDQESQPRRRPVSRPPAKPATPRRNGRAPSSITTPRPSSPLTGKHTASACAAVPRQQRLQGNRRQLCRLPHGDLPGHQESQPRRHRLPDHLRNLPHHGAVAGRQVRSQHRDQVRRSPASTPRCNARPAT